MTNSDASGQIFAFMPQLIASTLSITSSEVVTDSLEAYTPASSSSSNARLRRKRAPVGASAADSSDILSVYLAYIPASYVDALGAAIKAPNSAFYTQSTGLAKELSRVVNPTLPITSYAAQGVSNAASGDDGDGGVTVPQGGSGSGSGSGSGQEEQTSEADKKRKTVIIAVVTSLGVGILAILAYMAFSTARKGSKGKKGNSSSTGSGANAANGMRQLHLSSSGHSPTGQYAFAGQRSNNGNGIGGRPVSDSSSFSSGSDETHTSSSGHSHDNWRQQHGGASSGRSSSIDFASVDMQDVRNSWWRFSDGFGRAISSPSHHGVATAGHSPTSPMSQGSSNTPGRAVMRQTSMNRRINIQRGPGGGFNGISRPQMQENSLML